MARSRRKAGLLFGGFSQIAQKRSSAIFCTIGERLTLSKREIMNEINDLTYIIRGAIFEVYTTLGPGLLESVYEAELLHELDLRGLRLLHNKKCLSFTKM